MAEPVIRAHEPHASASRYQRSVVSFLLTAPAAANCWLNSLAAHFLCSLLHPILGTFLRTDDADVLGVCDTGPVAT